MAKPTWSKASERFAKGAKGEVHVFLDKAKGKKPDSIWRKIERPALKNNPDVGKIIYHWV